MKDQEKDAMPPDWQAKIDEITRKNINKKIGNAIGVGISYLFLFVVACVGVGIGILAVKFVMFTVKINFGG